jgi:hypothetical protein
MMPPDHDLIAKISSLPERNRANFLQFFGVSSMSEGQIAELEDSLAASIAMKKAFAPVKAN